jgi:hypothetical protein
VGESCASVQQPFPPPLLAKTAAPTPYDAPGAAGGPDLYVQKDGFRLPLRGARLTGSVAPTSSSGWPAILGFTHLQFEALLTARESSRPYDFALVAMLGLPGLRIFEADAANVADLGEEPGHRALRLCGKGTKSS